MARLAGLGLCLVVVALMPLPLQAQYSPNCERNGRRLSCAFTPWPAAAPPGLEVGRLVFADHSVVEVRREEGSCRLQGAVRTCRAWILSPPGTERPLAATYRGTAREGSYQHAYLSPGLRLSFWFLD